MRAESVKKLLAPAILAAVAAALVLAGLVLFTQLGEILDQKDFWNNFSSSQA